jgi:hypothetical protein
MTEQADQPYFERGVQAGIERSDRYGVGVPRAALEHSLSILQNVLERHRDMSGQLTEPSWKIPLWRPVCV